MVRSFLKENKKWICLMTLIMMLQLVVASYFCMQKQGFHYDEYHSYYSSILYWLEPTHRLHWKNNRNNIHHSEILVFAYKNMMLQQVVTS